MAEMCRPNPVPRWQRARSYAKGKKEPFSAFRSCGDTADSDYSFPTPLCQHLGCWQETPHQHSDEEIAHHSQAPTRPDSEPEDDEQRVYNYLSHFADDKELMKDLHPLWPGQIPTRPPPRLRGPGSSRSLIDGSTRGIRELRRALPTISEISQQSASSMSLPIRPRPPSHVAEVPDRSVESTGEPTVTYLEAKALSPPDKVLLTTTRFANLALENPDSLPWEEIEFAAELARGLNEETRRTGMVVPEDDVECISDTQPSI